EVAVNGVVVAVRYEIAVERHKQDMIRQREPVSVVYQDTGLDRIYRLAVPVERRPSANRRQELGLALDAAVLHHEGELVDAGRHLVRRLDLAIEADLQAAVHPLAKMRKADRAAMRPVDPDDVRQELGRRG